MNPVEETREFRTEVLTEYYDDYLDTVVEPIATFDPALFTGASQSGNPQSAGAPATQPSLSPQPAWSNAATTSVAQMEAAPAKAPRQVSPQSVDRATGQANAWTSGTSSAPAPAPSASDEATWVLGASPTSPEPTEVPLVGQTDPTPFPQQRTQAVSYGVSQMPASAPVSRPVSAPAPTPWQPPVRPSPYMPLEEKKETNPIIIGVVIGLAIIAIVAITVAVINAFGPKDPVTVTPPSSATSQAAPVVITAPSSDAASSGSADYSGKSDTEKSGSGDAKDDTTDPVPYDPRPKKTGGMTEADFYASLKEAYDKAGDYDKSIADCASDFNANFLNESMQLRSTKASAASSLKAKIKSDWNDLKDLKSKGMPIWSKNQEAYGQLCECYECLWNRIDVIDRAWNISLKYDKKEDLEKHKDEIIAPLAADQVGGNNKYFTRFKELYPSIKLEKP